MCVCVISVKIASGYVGAAYSLPGMAKVDVDEKNSDVEYSGLMPCDGNELAPDYRWGVTGWACFHVWIV